MISLISKKDKSKTIPDESHLLILIGFFTSLCKDKNSDTELPHRRDYQPLVNLRMLPIISIKSSSLSFFNSSIAVCSNAGFSMDVSKN